MMTPTVFGDPGKMSDTQFFCASDGWTNPNGDSGGVHINSGVPNHAFALMVDGGTYNGQTVTGIGLAKAARIQYRALTTYLTSGSGFRDNSAALNAVVHGPGGHGRHHRRRLHAGRHRDSGRGDGEPASVRRRHAAARYLLPAGRQSGSAVLGRLRVRRRELDAVFDDREQLELFRYRFCEGWSADGIRAGRHRQFRSPHGDEQLRGHPRQRAAWPSITRSSSSTPRRRFYDGGVLEFSTNNGASWNDAGSLIDAGQAYNGTLDPTNALGARTGVRPFQFRLHRLAAEPRVAGRPVGPIPIPYRHGLVGRLTGLGHRQRSASTPAVASRRTHCRRPTSWRRRSSGIL